MIVVSDATPIISLIKIGQLHLLEKLFGTVLIPLGVFQELTANPKFSQEAALIKAVGYIEAIPVKDSQAVWQLRERTGLDKGESEAIILTKERSALSLLIDERKGRRVAHQEGIKITGTLGILKSAYEEGLLSKQDFIASLTEIKASALRISDKMIDEILNSL